MLKKIINKIKNSPRRKTWVIERAYDRLLKGQDKKTCYQYLRDEGIEIKDLICYGESNLELIRLYIPELVEEWRAKL